MRKGQDGVANLLDDDGALEGGLLGIVPFQLHAGRLVPDAVGRSGRVVADLLGHERRLARRVGPGAEEQLSEEGVQRLLLVAKLLAPAGVLVLERGEEPLEDDGSAPGRVGLTDGLSEDGRVGGPVGRELRERLRREDEWRSR